MKRLLGFYLIMIVFSPLLVSTAQSDLAATLEVLNEGVEVRRVNTAQWIPVRLEAIVGVGDRIRTNDKGRARIIFFADGTETDLQINTEYEIQSFKGDANSFQISVSVLSGQTTQRLNRLLDNNSSYDINTPGMELAARGTVFQIRVENNGRTGMLVSEGAVAAADSDAEAEVPPGFGIRSGKNESLSDVVAATTFDQLDAALDGCAVSLTTPDDLSINVRLGPSREAPRVGTIAAEEIGLFFGQTQSTGWYRIAFRGNFAWITSSTAQVAEGCAGLRRFPDDFAGEDPSLYDSLGDTINVEDLILPSDG